MAGSEDAPGGRPEVFSVIPVPGAPPVRTVTASVDGKKPAKSAGDKLIRLARIQQAIALRKSGCSYAQIATHLKCSTMSAHRMVARGVRLIADRIGEDSRVIKAMIVGRMDHATLKLSTLLDNKKNPPDTPTTLQIIDRLGRLDERRARLEGLIDGEKSHPAPVLINVDMRTRTAERMAPLLNGATFEEKLIMLEIIEAAEARAASAMNSAVVIGAAPQPVAGPILDPADGGGV